MKNVFVLVALVAGLLVGGFVGSWSGRSARETLKKVEEAGRLADVENKKQVDALNAKMASLVTDYQRDTKALNDAHARQSAELNAAISGAHANTTRLEAANTQTHAKIQQLKTDLAKATTPQAKLQIQGQLDQQIGVVDRQSGQIKGLQCLDATVPADVLTAWNGNAP